ncbi:MAG: hypothetical protein HZB92_03205 [Euryarchaeota archaeon]|nr:hypothetical protein [Euryarchaeota archaeon]
MGYIFNPWVAPYVASVIILIFVTYIFYRTRGSPLNSLAAFLLAFVTLMVAGNMVMALADDLVSFNTWLEISGFFGVCVPTIYVHLALFLGKKGRVRDYPRYFLVYLPIALLYAVLIYDHNLVASDIVAGQSIYGMFSYTIKPFLAAFLIYSNVGMGMAGIAICYWKYRSPAYAHLRESAKFLCLAPLVSAVMIVLDLGIQFSRLPVYFSPNYAMYFLVGIIVAYGVLKHGMLELESKVRGAVISFATALLSTLIILPLIVAFMLVFESVAIVLLLGSFVFLIIMLFREPLERGATRLIEALSPKLKWRDCRVEEIFLVHNATGALIAHSRRPDRAQGIDKDVVAGMLSAVQNFVRDSFNIEERETLRTLYIGKTKMMIEHSTHVYLALIFTGYDSEELRRDLRGALAQIEGKHKSELSKWTGVMDSFDSDGETFRPFFAHGTGS